MNEFDLGWLPVPVGEQDPLDGEMVRLVASISGEMDINAVPYAPWATPEAIGALKAGDTDPMEVVVEVPVGKSTRGWFYTPKALHSIVKTVQEGGLPGIKGHTKEEDYSTEFKDPVTHWVGAKFENNKAYFRGVVDKKADDIKRWIRAKVLRQVSIWGFPKLAKVSGETHVVDYVGKSIDWTPLDRSGMPTRIVAVGEMDEIMSEKGGSREMELHEALKVIAAAIAAGKTTAKAVFGEIGFATIDKIAGEMDVDWREVNGAAETLTKVQEALGITGEMDIIDFAKKAKDAMDAQGTAEFNKTVNEVLGEKVKGEMAQNIVRPMLHLEAGATKEAIAGEIDRVLSDENVKKAIEKLYVDDPSLRGGGGAAGEATGKVRMVSI